jgi:hypothetical protein
MEAGDPTVSLDLRVRSLPALGASDRELGRFISSGRRRDDREYHSWTLSCHFSVA